MRLTHTLRNFLLGSALLAAVIPAHAVDYYFDTNGTASGFGSANGAYSGTLWSTSLDGTAAPALASSYPIGEIDQLNFGTSTLGYGTLLGTSEVTGNRKFTGAGNLRIGSASGNIKFTGGWEIAGTFGNGIRSSSTATVEFSGLIIGNAGSVSQTGSGTLILSNTANTWGGSNTATDNVTTISGGGTIRVNKLANGGATSSLGDSSNVATRLVFDNGTLIHYGTAASSTNRNFTIKSGGATIKNDSADSAHTLTWSGTATLDAAADRSLTLGGSNTGNNTFSGILADNGAGKLSLTKADAGTWVLDQANTYTGATTVSQGTLIINGSNASTSLSIAANATLGGSGTFASATLGGAGSIDPGNSPGIQTAVAVDPSGGLDFNFEFTAANTPPAWALPTNSTNDVLRLTGGTPFTGNLDLDNLVNIYLNVGSLSAGQTYTGGFYTDATASFISSITGADFNYFLANPLGTEIYNGINYDAYTGPLGFSVSAIPQTADFGAGSVNGYVTQFTVVAIPEPRAVFISSLGMLMLLRRRRH